MINLENPYKIKRNNSGRIHHAEIDCHFYQMNTCTYGSRCKFNHEGIPRGYCRNPCSKCNTNTNQIKNNSSNNERNDRNFQMNPSHYNQTQLNTSNQFQFSSDNISHLVISNNMPQEISTHSNRFSAPISSRRPLNEAFSLDGLFMNFRNLNLNSNSHENEENDYYDLENEHYVEFSSFPFQDLFTHQAERIDASKKEETKIEREPEIILEEESDLNKACSVCMIYKKDHAFIPCGHQAICGKCAQERKRFEGKCVICRKEFKEVCKIFI